jgi:hypothetical protein
VTPSLSDLRNSYYGGGSAAEYQILLAAQAAGVTAADLVNLGYHGNGSPEGVVTAPVGSLYLARDTGFLYTKQAGAGNTGWVLGSGAAAPAGAVTLIGHEKRAADSGNGALWTPTGFTAIPQTYAYLKVVLNVQRPASQPGGNDVLCLRLNGDATGNYNNDGTLRALNWNETNAPCGLIGAYMCSNEIDFYAYARTDYLKHISFKARGNNGGSGWARADGQSGWQVVTAINSMAFFIPAGNAFGANSEAWLYGMAAS